MGVPLNHQLLDGFSIVNHPATGVPWWLWKPPYEICSTVDFSTDHYGLFNQPLYIIYIYIHTVYIYIYSIYRTYIYIIRTYIHVALIPELSVILGPRLRRSIERGHHRVPGRPWLGKFRDFVRKNGDFHGDSMVIMDSLYGLFHRNPHENGWFLF